MYNNTIYNNPYTAGIALSAGSGAVVRNNIVYQNGGNIVNGSASAVALSNNLTADPKFVNAGSKDFRLQSTSPAVDAGLVISALASDIGRSSPPSRRELRHRSLRVSEFFRSSGRANQRQDFTQ